MKGISKLKRRRQDGNRKKEKWKTKKPQDGDLEDALPPPPIPPYTTDMFIPATVSSASIAGLQYSAPNINVYVLIIFTAFSLKSGGALAPPPPPSMLYALTSHLVFNVLLQQSDGVVKISPCPPLSSGIISFFGTIISLPGV